MTTQEAAIARNDAEAKILQIVRDLEDQTNCRVSRIELEREETVTNIPLSLEVKIDLRLR